MRNDMPQIVLDYLRKMPILLSQLVSELKEMNEKLANIEKQLNK